MSPRETPRGEPRESSRERADQARAIFEMIARRMDDFMGKDVLSGAEQKELDDLYNFALRIEPLRKAKNEPRETMKKAA